MKISRIRVNDPWFTYIKNGAKKYEGRRNNRIFNEGEYLLIQHNTDECQDPVTKMLKKIHKFKTFEEALSILPLEEVLPGVKTVEEGVQIYYKFVSLETQLRDGVVMLELEEAY